MPSTSPEVAGPTEPWSTKRAAGMPMRSTGTARRAGSVRPSACERLQDAAAEAARAGRSPRASRPAACRVPRPRSGRVEGLGADRRRRRPPTSRRAASRSATSRPRSTMGPKPDEQHVRALAQHLALRPPGSGSARPPAGRSRRRVGSAARTDGPARTRSAAGAAAAARRAATRSTRLGSWRWAASVNMPWWLVPSSPTRPARSTPMTTGASFWHTSWTTWSKARWRNVE